MPLPFKAQGVMLALQALGAHQTEMTDAEAQELMTLGLIIGAIAFVVIIIGVWMVIDAWVNYSPGWSVGSGVGCLLGTLGCGVGGCLVIIPYLIIRFAAMPPSRYRERMARQGYIPPAGGGTSPPAWGGAQQQSVPQDLELAPQERDERIDEMLAQGKAREAMDYAQQMFKMAQDFKDAGGQARYRKYIERIRLGIR